MHRFTKRLLALLLALLMCLSLFPAAALAEGEDEPADEAVEATVAGSPDEPAEDEIPNDPDTELDALPPAEDEIEESSSGTCGDDLTWTLDENGLLTISGTGEIMDYGPVPPPFYQIGSQVLSLQIDTGVTAIGDYFLYGCSGLSSVTIPGNITRIGSYAFANCSGMTELVLSEGLLRIGEKAFSNCSSLYSLSIPASAAEFGDYPFNGCSSLTEIHYGGTVSAWQQLDLAYDRMKVTVYCADGNVTPIDPSLCGDNLTWSLSGDGVLTISGTGDMWNWEPCNSPDTTTPFVPAWSTQREQIKSVVIEPGVTSIGAHAFDCCTALTAVTIPDTVTQIRGNAFNQCSSLTGISIPESVTVIDSAVFQLCHALTDIVIPDGVTEIRTAAFNGCTSLSSLTLPASLSSIGEKAFLQCVGLTEIRFCGHAPSFGSDVFSCYSSDSVITATAYYPSGDATWTDAVRQNYGGTITWLPCMSVNEESVPDPIFRDYILQQFDSDGDGMLSEEERLAVTVIDLEGSGVASLEGIALFPNLEELNAGGDFETAGQLTEVDLSANTRLKSLNLGFNQDLGQLDVSMLPELESLMVGFCGLSELDLSGNPALRELWCDNNNLAALDLSANPNLEHLDCCGNEELYFLDIRPCPSLVADYKAGGRHISWMEEAMPEMYESILVYGGTGDEDYRLAVNTWTHIQYASFVLVSVSYYYSDTGFARGYSGGNLEGNDLTLTAEEKEGYSFLGWYLVTEKDETGLPVAYGELLCAEAAYTFVLSENISLVAVYEKESARTCTVSFDMQGHGTAPAAQTVNEGDCAAEPEAPTAEGWLFGGWYTDPDCTEPYAFTTPVTEDITLYAKWTPSGHLPGDINGDGKVNNKDVTRLQKYLKGDEVEVNEAALDMNGDGKVNNKDLTRLQKYLKGDEVEIF